MPEFQEDNMPDSNRAALRAAGAKAAASLPPISAECARSIAELMRQPINQYISTMRRAVAARAGDTDAA
jgi:hypothetical protein